MQNLLLPIREKLLYKLLIISLLLIQCGNPKYSEQDIQRLKTFRKSKDNYFSFSPTSPIPEFQKEYFKGLNYFPPNGEFKFQAELIPEEKYDSVAKLPVAGKIKFKYKNKTYFLTAYYENDSTLFVPFKDLTNGKETYEGGRYLNIPIKKNAKKITLDFNYAYNPYCAYNPNYVCTLPPEENYLDFPVKAGEKKLFEELK